MKKGLTGWVELFRVGSHIDHKGRRVDVDHSFLDNMVSKYDPGNHEAPAVIGHPKADAPAYAWVEAIKRSGDVLLGKFKQVAAEFNEMVKEGRYKKRSISVYPDGGLKHVGFLGAMPPAVKGLKDVAFTEDDDIAIYEFSTQEDDSMQKTLEQLQEDLRLEKEARKKAEKNALKFKEQADEATSNFNQAQADRLKTEIRSFVEQGIKDGKILPAWKDQGLAEFMEHLSGSDDATLEFAEGDKKKPLDWFKGFISNFSEHPLFKDMVKPADETGGKDSEFAEDMKTAKEMAASVNQAEK